VTEFVEYLGRRVAGRSSDRCEDLVGVKMLGDSEVADDEVARAFFAEEQIWASLTRQRRDLAELTFRLDVPMHNAVFVQVFLRRK
jgi:hypothetical protein